MSTTHDNRLADWRQKMAVHELQQALEFDSGKRDYYFGDVPPDDLPTLRLRRAGAVEGCILTALGYLTGRSMTLKQRRQEHDAGVCDDLCPTCNPQEWD